MIKIFNAEENTNSCHVTGWEITDEPFKAYRSFGTAHTGFLPFCNNFAEKDYCKIIKTKKGNNLLINCQKNQDEDIYLWFCTGGFRGCFSSIVAQKNVEIISQKDSYKHCNPSISLVFIIAQIVESYIVVKLTGRYCPYYYILKNKEFTLIKSTEEFETFADINNIEIK